MQNLVPRSCLNAGNSASIIGRMSGLCTFSSSLKPCPSVVVCLALSSEPFFDVASKSPFRSLPSSAFKFCCKSLLLPYRTRPFAAAGVIGVSSNNACHRARKAPGPKPGSTTGRCESSRVGLVPRLLVVLEGRLLGRLGLWKRYC